MKAFLVLLLCLPLAGHAAPRWMPMPSSVTPAQGALRIDRSFRVEVTGFQEPRLRRAAARTMERVEKQTGLLLDRGERKAVLTLTCEHAGKTVQQLGEDEAYVLDITPQGAGIHAAQPLGILRGIETFLQAIESDRDGYMVAAVHIEDHPRFPWRGLSYDVSRHFIPVAVIERNLDAMAAVKLNVFHWHLSDDQGFRVESKLYPRLHTAGSEGMFYTQAEVRALVAHARERGIRVVPEFDIPGHTTAMQVAYPKLAMEPAPTEVDHAFGVRDPLLDPTRESTYVFLDRLIGEMAALFPDAYFHIGGDEVRSKMWAESERIKAFQKARHIVPTETDKDGAKAVQALFNRRILAIVKKHGKRMEGWDEILTADAPKDILIQSWRGAKSLSEAARNGYSGILSSGFYLDLAQPANMHYAVEPFDAEASTLSEDEQKRILGGEAAMWSEYVTAETVDSRVWPRCAAIAERLWSPREVRDAADMYRRMEITSAWLGTLGLTHDSGYEPMLARLAGTAQTGDLRTLVDVLEPVKGYERERFDVSDSRAPLVHLIDAARPESMTARSFAQRVDETLRSGTGWGPLRVQLEYWRDNQERLRPVIQGSGLLADAAPVSASLSALASIGLEAVDLLSAGKAADADWKKQKLDSVRNIAEPRSGVILVITDSVAKLVRSVRE